MTLTPIELGHQIRDMAHKVEAHWGQYPDWLLVSPDIAPVVSSAVEAAGLSIEVHIRHDMPPGTNFHMGCGDVPETEPLN